MPANGNRIKEIKKKSVVERYRKRLFKTIAKDKDKKQGWNKMISKRKKVRGVTVKKDE